MTTKEFAKILQDKLTSEYGVDLSVASKQQIYRSLALICRQMMSENHKKFQSKAIGTGTKQVYYLCMEFLMGRSLKMSLFNLGLNDAAQKALAEADAWGDQELANLVETYHQTAIDAGATFVTVDKAAFAAAAQDGINQALQSYTKEAQDYVAAYMAG